MQGSRVAQAVQRIFEAKSKYTRLEYDEEDGQVLNPPASTGDLAWLEARLGSVLPPTYREFLSLHDGWLGFSGEAMLLPAREHEAPWVQKKRAELEAHLAEFFSPAILASAFIVMLGREEKNFVFLDTKSRLPTGELEVVNFDMVDGEYGRYASFVAYLEYVAKRLEKRLAAL